MNVDALDRLEAIRRALVSHGRVRIASLAAELDVSEMTIRRDLELLADEGVARRIRGGAIAVGPQEFGTRSRERTRAKSIIGQKLLGLVPSRGAIGIDASSTAQRLATRLGDHDGLTVITNGPDTFSVLNDRANITALLTGGQLDERTGSLVGPLAVRAAREILLARLFVGASALDPLLGSSEATLAEAEVKIAFAASADDVVLAVDASKLGQRAPARTLELTRIGTIVTDLDPGDDRLDPYRDTCAIV